jgi:apolipoprotein N-acyltransferase
MGRKTLLLLSVASGLLLSLPWIFPSFSLVMFIAFIPLLFVEDQITLKKHSKKSIVLFLYALSSFFVWNVLSTWWIAFVSLSGMIIIAAINAFLMAFVWWMMHLVRRKFAAMAGYLSLVVFWLTFEFLHFNWSINWPWLTLGNGFANSVKLVQWYEFSGVLGGSLWVLLSNILIFRFIKSVFRKEMPEAVKFGSLSIAIILLPVCLSLFQYHNYKENGEVREVVILQPNIDPFTEKFSGMGDEEQTQRLISLAETIISDSTDYVLAPETALAQMWEDQKIHQNVVLQPVNSLIDKYPNVRFIVGAMTKKEIVAGQPVSSSVRQTDDGRLYNVFNSALMVDHSGKVQVGHKSLLVSGVEKMPFEKYFSFLRKYTVDLGGVSGSLSSSGQLTVFDGSSQDKIGSVICFESAFGAHVGNAVANGANLIFVMTNDGWWKDSPGVGQHFSYSRLRAIETRRSVVRSANTGISGFINQKGDVVKKSGVNTSTAIISEIRINNTITFYVLYGDYIGRISMFLSGLILIYLIIQKQKDR